MVTAHDFCERIVVSPDLASKLETPPHELDFNDAPPPRIIRAPGRAPELSILPAREVKVPRVAGMADRSQRARILHALANHELQAIELFAWAVLAFPGTPVAFRRGLVAILADEQRHFELYRARLRAHGVEFGELGVTGHFWNQLEALSTPLGFLCAMGLTFENANLDFAGEYRRAADDAGDAETAEAIAIVHHDEERHVRFAVRWVTRFADDGESVLDVYRRTVRFPLGPARARGKEFDRPSRERAGLDDEFIDALEGTDAVRPSGAPR